MLSTRIKMCKNIVQTLESFQFGQNCKKTLEEFAEIKVATNACHNTRYEVRAKSTFLIAFSPDRSTVASSHGDHTIKIFSVKTGKLIRTLSGHTRTAWSLSYHPCLSNIIASGSLAGEIRVWDLNTGDFQCFNLTNGNVISSLSFHGDDDFLAVASSNKLYFLNWRTGSVLTTLTTASLQESIRIIRFGSSSNWMLTGILNDPDEKEQSLGDVGIQRNPAFGRHTIQTVSCHRLEDRTPTTTASLIPDSTTTATTIMSSSRTSAQNARDDSPSSCGCPRESALTRRNREEYASQSRRSEHRYASRTRDRNLECLNRIEEEGLSSDANNERPDHVETSDTSLRSFNDVATDFSSNRNDLATDVSHNRNVPAQAVVRTVGTSTNSDDNVDQTQTEGLSGSSNSSNNENGASSFRDSNSLSSVNQETGASLRRNLSESFERTSSRPRRRRGGNLTSRASRVWTNLNSLDRPFRSEIWNVDMGQGDAEVIASQVTIASTSNGQSLGDLALASRSAIPVYSFISYPSDTRYSSSISGVEPDAHAIATATARTPRHVHTAVVIAGSNENESETALRTAINRAIAGAFAGNGEGAVAANIVNTTYRIQLWELSHDVMADLSQSKMNVIVPHCKLHNDGSIDVSQDGTALAAYVPSTQGFPENGNVCVFSLRKETLGQCIYSRAYGPNSVCVSFSPLGNYLLVGLASRRVVLSSGSEELMGQILKLPGEGEPAKHDDIDQVVFNMVHPKKGQYGSSVSVNTAKFHPSPGVGIIYGTNHGTVRHCRVGRKVSKRKLSFH